MSRLPRVLLCGGLLLLLPACQSPDSGKLVGRWLIVSAPGVTANVTEIWEFKSDGTCSLTAAGRTAVTAFTGRYRLDYRNHLRVDHLNKPVKGLNAIATQIVFTADGLNMEDDDGRVTCLRRAP